jgi:hypothetical protein
MGAETRRGLHASLKSPAQLSTAITPDHYWRVGARCAGNGNMKKVSAVIWLLIFFNTAVDLQAQQLRTEYPEIRLSDKRILAQARVESFDGISFCISHQSGIEGAVPWEVMPSLWQTDWADFRGTTSKG